MVPDSATLWLIHRTAERVLPFEELAFYLMKIPSKVAHYSFSPYSILYDILRVITAKRLIVIIKRPTIVGLAILFPSKGLFKGLNGSLLLC